jgi:hypothetical protein
MWHQLVGDVYQPTLPLKLRDIGNATRILKENLGMILLI